MEKIPPNKKTCCLCNIEKETICFGKNSKSKDGLKYQCRDCRKKEKQNKDKKSNWYKKDKSKNPQKYIKKYNEQNSKRKKQKHDWYVKNYKPKKKNVGKIKCNSLRYKKIRSCLYQVLKSNSKKINKNLGYSSKQLISHIEKLWINGMSWENYGEWQIDHIIPICQFPENASIQTINSLVNLRPLWKINKILDGKVLEGNLNRRREKINFEKLNECSIILDIDGTLIHHYLDENGNGLELDLINKPTIILPNVIDNIKKWNELNYHIIITTARKEELRELTKNQLKNLKINYNELLMEVSGPRIIINDMKTDSYEPTAIAVNLKRNEGMSDLDLQLASDIQTLANCYKVKLEI